MRNHALSLGVGLMLTACSGSWLEPSFSLPSLGDDTTTVVASTGEADPLISPTVVGSWQVVESAMLEKPVVNGAWWKALNLPGLDDLMAQALRNNPDVELMAARVQQSRAEADVASAGLFPSLSLQADATRGRASPAQTGGTATAESTVYGTALGASYELDLFGRIAGNSKASKLAALSQQALADNVTLIVQVSVVQAWANLRAAEENLANWQTLLAEAEERQKFLQLRYAAGDLPADAWQAGLANLQNLRIGALAAASVRQHAHSALAILVGKTPQEFTPPASMMQGDWGMAPAVPQGISATVLVQRPDVKAAALQLQATNAAIGAARAAFLPRINLTALGGFASGDLGDMFDWNNRTWSAGPVLTLPIFQGGALRANLRRSWAVYDQAVAVYRGMVLGAFRDAADAVEDARLSREQASSATQAAEAAVHIAQAAEARYKLGDAAKADLLTASINARQARIAAASTQAASYGALARLIQALGGSW